MVEGGRRVWQRGGRKGCGRGRKEGMGCIGRRVGAHKIKSCTDQEAERMSMCDVMKHDMIAWDGLRRRREREWVCRCT